jgi:hypothetical protein
MEPRPITEGNGDAILQSGARREWLRSDTVVDLDEWA